MTDTVARDAIWLDEAAATRVAERFGTPAYVYDARQLRARARAFRTAFPETSSRVFYAMKANANRQVLRILRREGLGVETVSPWEARLALELGHRPNQVVFTPSMPSDEDLRWAAKAGVQVTLDALSTIERFGRMARGARIWLRRRSELEDGHHPHVQVGGEASKFGLADEDWDDAVALASRRGLTITGVHQHVGSGLTDPLRFAAAAEPLFARAAALPGVETVNVGGGFGVPYHPEDPDVPLEAWRDALAAVRSRWEGHRPGGWMLGLEPGRWLVATMGVLLARVTTVKRARNQSMAWVGTDSGMHHLVRPALYGAWHPIRTFPSREGEPMTCAFVGPICEHGDVLGVDRVQPVPREGDLVAVGVAGAYGYAMSSTYTLRARPAEVLVDGDHVRCLTRRARYGELTG